MVEIVRHDVDGFDVDYAMRVVQARCPEVADLIVPVSVLKDVLALIAEMQDRIDRLEAQPPPQSLLFN